MPFEDLFCSSSVYSFILYILCYGPYLETPILQLGAAGVWDLALYCFFWPIILWIFLEIQNDVLVQKFFRYYLITSPFCLWVIFLIHNDFCWIKKKGENFSHRSSV